jgi:hypothetical protein
MDYLPRDYPPISVPANWTAQQDIEFFEERWGESTDYFGEVRERVLVAHEELEQLLHDALDFFDASAAPAPVSTLTEIIAAVEARLMAGPYSHQHQAWLKVDLAYCRYALGEFDRLAPSLDEDGDGGWLMPQCDLSDHLVTATINLDETLRFEFHAFEEDEPE